MDKTILDFVSNIFMRDNSYYYSELIDENRPKLPKTSKSGIGTIAEAIAAGTSVAHSDLFKLQGNCERTTHPHSGAPSEDDKPMGPQCIL